MLDSPVFISEANGPLRTKGLDFIQDCYNRVFGTLPRDEPDRLLVAYREEPEPFTVVGTIGVSFWSRERPIRLSRIYAFDSLFAPLPVIPESIFEYGRLTATRTGLSKALIAAANQCALACGRTIGWCEHANNVHRLCESFGLQFFPTHARLKPEIVRKDDLGFYKKNPSVELYMTDARDWFITLAGTVTYENRRWRVL